MTDLKQFFYSHPVFRYETFVEFMSTRGTISLNSCQQRLQYHLKMGNIIAIKRGLYAVPNPMTDSKESFCIDPFIVAGNTTKDAVLAYHTALELHDLAYTTFETLTFIVDSYTKPFRFQSQLYQPVHTPGSLIKQSKEDFGIETITRSGVGLKITNLERTIVDVIDRPELGGGWEEIWRSLEHLVTLNTDILIEYLLLLGKATTVAKVGFFLEKLTTMHGIDKTVFDELTKHIPKQPCYLERRKQEKGSLIKKWNLIVPDEIINQSWEESYEADI